MISAANKKRAKRKAQVRESQVEDAFCQRVKDLGGLALKFTSPARRSVPDRLVLMPGARASFCELKRPGEKPSESQHREHERLRALGFRVDVIDNIADAKNWKE